jgi:integrase
VGNVAISPHFNQWLNPKKSVDLLDFSRGACIMAFHGATLKLTNFVAPCCPREAPAMPTDHIELTDVKLKNLKPAPAGQRYEIADKGVRGLRVRVGDGVIERGEHRGKASQIQFVLLGRFPPSTNPTRRLLGSYSPNPKGPNEIGLADARAKAVAWKDTIKKGSDPQAETRRQQHEAEERRRQAEANKPKTFKEVSDDFLKRHVRKEGQKDGKGKPVPPLRTAAEIGRIFERYIWDDPEGKPRWRDRPFTSIRRLDVTELIDDVQDRNGSTQADAVLAQLSKLFNWYASRADDYTSPIVRGMKRTKSKDRARKRILDDDEIKLLWQATDDGSTYGAFLRVGLLTGQRRAKIAEMKWDQLHDDGTWTIPADPGEKANAQQLKLPKMVMDIIRARKRRIDNDFVFAGRLKGPINGFSKFKAEVDATMEEARGGPIEPWVFHDLRRSAKSLMARARVPRDISERVLGHTIPGVEGVYDRHTYAQEKADALKKLAALVGRIVAPAKNVVPITKAGAA